MKEYISDGLSHCLWHVALGNYYTKYPIFERKYKEFSRVNLTRHNSALFSPSVQFSHSVVSDSLRPHESQHTRPPCPSATPRAYSNSCPSSQWCHPTISSSVIPFFSNESVLQIRWPKYCHFSCVQLCVTIWTAACQAPCPWDSPGKNTGVSCHCLLRGSSRNEM